MHTKNIDGAETLEDVAIESSLWEIIVKGDPRNLCKLLMNHFKKIAKDVSLAEEKFLRCIIPDSLYFNLK